jgi:hypothetical protein
MESAVIVVGLCCLAIGLSIGHLLGLWDAGNAYEEGEE